MRAGVPRSHAASDNTACWKVECFAFQPDTRVPKRNVCRGHVDRGRHALHRRKADDGVSVVSDECLKRWADAVADPPEEDAVVRAAFLLLPRENACDRLSGLGAVLRPAKY